MDDSGSYSSFEYLRRQTFNGWVLDKVLFFLQSECNLKMEAFARLSHRPVSSELLGTEFADLMVV